MWRDRPQPMQLEFRQTAGILGRTWHSPGPSAEPVQPTPGEWGQQSSVCPHADMTSTGLISLLPTNQESEHFCWLIAGNARQIFLTEYVYGTEADNQPGVNLSVSLSRSEGKPCTHSLSYVTVKLVLNRVTWELPRGLGVSACVVKP